MKRLLERILGVEIIRYGIVGVCSTALDYLFLNISHHLMNNADNKLWLATAIGFVAGLINGYYMNSRWTFKYKTKGKEAKTFSQFTIISLVGLGLTELIVLGFTSSGDLNKNIAKLIAVVIVFFWNYFGNKIWTFKK